MALRDLPRKLTYDDYVLIPEDGKRHEILDGEHYMSPTPFIRHQVVSSRLLCGLGLPVMQRKLGIVLTAPLDVLLSEHDIAQPDLLFVSNERMGICKDANIQGAPDLLVEILSEETRQRDEILKFDRYDRFGVLEYWMIDPDRKTVRVCRRESGRLRLVAELSAEDVLTSPLLPDLEIQLARIFE